MEFRKFGSSDLNASIIGLGCNNFGWKCDAAQIKTVVDAALDSGITFFDTADMYGDTRSEEMLGAALGARRSDVIVATKFGALMDENGKRKGASRAVVFESAEASLRRLGTDYIDLYQVHFPDRETPWAETMEALHELVQSGKVRFIGVSNVTVDDLKQTATIAAEKHITPFVSCQSEYSLLVRDVEKDVLPEVSRQSMGFLPYFPLASGMLTGKYTNGTPKGSRLEGASGFLERFADIHAVELARKASTFAAERNRTPVELAFSWLASHPVVTSIIAGATSPEQVRQNARAADKLMAKNEMSDLEKVLAA